MRFGWDRGVRVRAQRVFIQRWWHRG